jgi:hypothetical protein
MLVSILLLRSNEKGKIGGESMAVMKDSIVTSENNRLRLFGVL